MKSLRIKNLRCLEDTGEVPIKDITILVGANSSGKSTFLRTFPLLKQGLNVHKKGPILWFGDYVDFGDFKTSVRSGESNIAFEFKISLANRYMRTLSYFRHVYQMDKYIDIEYNLYIEISATKTYEYISKIKIDFLSYNIVLIIDKSRKVNDIIVNEISFFKDITKDIDLEIDSLNGNLFELHFVAKKDSPDSNFKFNRRAILKTVIEKVAVNNLRELIGSRKTDDSIADILRNIKLTTEEKTIEILKGLKISAKWDKSLNIINSDSDLYIKMSQSIALCNFNSICEFINFYVSDTMSEVYYIAPLRATAQRYYRMQNLSLSEIDSAGQNLPLYIHNLTDAKFDKYKKWVNDKFGFYPEAVADGGHISLRLTDARSMHNITDKGFGYSQILPIITQLWSIVFNRKQSTRHRTMEKAIVVIEQPELHLHPRLQAMLTDAFVTIVSDAKNNNFELKIIIETHSPTIVNKLGTMVAEKRISADDITIAMFENDVSKEGVKLSHYDEDGVLIDWPIGFFDF